MKLGFSQLRFKFVGLDREDELANASIYKIRYEANAITPNDATGGGGSRRKIVLPQAVTNGASDSQKSRCRFAHKIAPFTRWVARSM
jgi:hypothetical protein